MPLSDREAFKVGFLARCVEDGLDRDQMLQTVKQAADKLAGFLGDIGGMASGAFHTAAPLALLAPPALGALAGAGLAKATDIDDADVDDVKDREVIDAYQTEAAKLRRQKAVRDYARARQRTGRIFL